jgi:hypothetical protein
MKDNRYFGVVKASSIIISSFRTENKLVRFDYKPEKEDYSKLLISQRIPLLPDGYLLMMICIACFMGGIGSAYIYYYGGKLKLHAQMIKINKRYVDKLIEVRESVKGINPYHLKLGYLIWKYNMQHKQKKETQYNQQQSSLNEDMFI